MAHQSPMISIPRKSTDEVDWTSSIRNLIAQSYGENPDNYSTECATLQRCRQDAVRGAGSDLTARDLLYKYFGQLELLELRFSEIRVVFPWRDAFTNKLITQTSIAYEKASILFQIAATHSAIASSQSRSDPEGLKRAFHYFKSAAGMLTYINENFLHAPSTDLSREVVKFLVSIILAQATEVFFEKTTDEKKGAALVSKIGAQTAYMYTSLTEEVKEFMGKGIFDRNWVTLIQIKARYFTSLSHYYRALADDTAGKHGDALVRFTLAETNAKEASRLAGTFNSSFISTVSPTLPADAGSSIVERIKAHLAICTDRKAEAQRENDLIYNAVLPSPEALPPIDKLSVATATPIQEVYGTPEVQKTIGQDIFIRLVPLSVHESASVYSEEKAKLVRSEVEKAEGAEGEARSVLDGMGVKEGLTRFRAMAEGEIGGEEEVPLDVRRWKDDIALIEGREPVEGLMGQLTRMKENVKRELDDVARDLEIESRDCEMMRVKYEHRWTQDPSSGLTKNLRQDLKSHFGSLEAAALSDRQVVALWETVKGDVGLLMSNEVEQVFRASTENGGGGAAVESLLDLDAGSEGDDANERAKIGGLVAEIDDRIGRLNKISRERNEVVKDLKEKIQTDDVSHLLLLNRRNTGVEPALFAAELEKFRPYQQRLAATVHHQQIALQEVAALWKTLRGIAGRGPGARKWEEREKRKNETVKRFSRARDGYMEVRDGLAKGLHFYGELTELTTTLRSNVKSFISSRTAERESLASQLEIEKRLSSSAAIPSKPPPPPRPTSGGTANDLNSSFASMNLMGRGSGTPSAPTPPPPTNQWPSPPTSSQSQGQGQYSSPMSYGGIPPLRNYPPSFSAFSGSPSPQQQQQQQQPTHVSRGSYGSGSIPGFPPPPPPPPSRSQAQIQPQAPYNSYSSPLPPPPPQQQQQQQGHGHNDPYASLGMFNTTPSSSSSSSSYMSGIPPQQQHYQPQQYSVNSPPPVPPALQAQPQRQQTYGYGFPPPPPAGYGVSQQQGGGYQGFGTPLPPPQQQQQGQQGQGQQGQGYAGW